jgi:FlaA1/EpsC-like NDP-sugar epimerase
VTTFFHRLSNLRNRHFFVLDLVAMLAVPTMALSIRLDNTFSWELYGLSLAAYTALSIAVKLIVYHRLGMYNHLWKYASIEEVSVILISIFSASFIFNILYFFAVPVIPDVPARIPRSVLIIDLLLSLALHGGFRLVGRLFSTELNKRNADHEPGQRVLIIGAGSSGTMIAKEMLRNPSNGLNPIGFIDDDSRKHGGVIYGIPVLGGRGAIPAVCKKMRVAQILIAMPSASGKTIQSFLRITEPLKIRTRTLPSVSELLNETVELRQFREIRIDDLLRRDPVKTDMSDVRTMLEGERVLVTGAGGSIGSELCRFIAQCRPASLCLLGHGENSIHAIHRELQDRYPELLLPSIIADVRDDTRIRAILEEHRPRFLYHAAAHKHVPLMEQNLVDAVTNNVLGTITLLRNARACGVSNFTLISTDKAVQPRSVMGVTKRLAELALQFCARENGAAASGAHFTAVRFGNVLGSRGSVVPLFTAQIAAGGPITITHPEMRRYFMTIPEAAQLVLQASTLHGHGQIFVLDMGQPIRVLDLAIDLVELSGLTPFKDIDIVYTGLRPGEKLNEQLFRQGEVFSRSVHEKIFVVADPVMNGGSHGAAHGLTREGGDPITTFDMFERYVREEVLDHGRADVSRIVRGIHHLVPEFQSEAEALSAGETQSVEQLAAS